MPTRVTDLDQFENAVRNIQRNRSELVRIQNQASSGRALQSAADDPGGTSRVLALRENLDRIDQFERNITSARAQLDHSESAIGAVSNVLVKARELAVSADTETDQFTQIRGEVDELFGQLVSLANTRVGDRFLFGGFVTNSPPITQTGTLDDPGPIVSYGGDSGVISAAIDSGAQLDLNVTARELFFGSTDGDDVADGGFVNLFNVLQDLHKRLDDPAANGPPSGVLDEIDAGLSQVNQLRSRIGSRTNRLDAANDQLGSLRIALEGERSGLEDADLVETITKLQQQESTYQASLSVTARVLQPSLLAFLS
jgi:flagellar hook-associated protein 3 FlgL